MAIKSIKSKKDDRWGPMDIDLTGPDGNVYCLMAIAEGVCRYNGIDPEPLIYGMKSGTYENAVKVFDQWLGGSFTLYR